MVDGRHCASAKIAGLPRIRHNHRLPIDSVAKSRLIGTYQAPGDEKEATCAFAQKRDASAGAAQPKTGLANPLSSAATPGQPSGGGRDHTVRLTKFAAGSRRASPTSYPKSRRGKKHAALQISRLNNLRQLIGQVFGSGPGPKAFAASHAARPRRSSQEKPPCTAQSGPDHAGQAHRQTCSGEGKERQFFAM